MLMAVKVICGIVLFVLVCELLFDAGKNDCGWNMKAGSCHYFGWSNIFGMMRCWLTGHPYNKMWQSPRNCWNCLHCTSDDEDDSICKKCKSNRKTRTGSKWEPMKEVE